MTATDVGLLVLRLCVATVMVAHGYHHIFGGGRIAGTARWFEGLGMRPGILHAWAASLTELGAGVLLAVGAFTPIAAAGVIGVMTVAGVTNHRRNGFFIFRRGEGYEYVLTLGCCGVALAGAGAGAISIDGVLGILQPPSWLGLALGLGLGVGGAVALLAACWRPAPSASP